MTLRAARVHDDFGDLYAPDVVRGTDGRYCLYYCISGDDVSDTHNTPIGVAVCDTPAGKYEYYGFVRNADGSPYLSYLPHDPAERKHYKKGRFSERPFCFIYRYFLCNPAAEYP